MLLEKSMSEDRESGEAPEEGYKGKVTRKPHRKSRFGCKNCKTRRIKCDETKPECLSCRKRRVRCDFLPASQPSPFGSTSSTSPNGLDNGLSPNAGFLNVADIELTYHYQNSTSQTLGDTTSTRNYWRFDVMQFAFTNHHVLRLLLAFTALHLAHARPDRREEYVAQADHHRRLALPTVTAQLAEIKPETCDSAYLAAVIICFIKFAEGPQPGEYLAFATEGPSEFYQLFRGVRIIRDTVGPEASLTRMFVPQVRNKGDRPLRHALPEIEFRQPLDELRQYVDVSMAMDDQRHDFLSAVDSLISCYNCRYGDGGDTEFSVVFRWLYSIPSEYITCLQQKHPVAMVVYVYFAILLKEMESKWYMKGWMDHIMAGVYSLLPDEHRLWMRWPIEQIGWIPP